MSEEKDLPEGWVIERLGDFAIYQKGKKPKNISSVKSDKFNVPYVNIKAFEKNIIEEYTNGEGCVLCENGDFLMVWDGARSGFVGKGIKGALGSTLVKINFPGIDLNYAYYYLQSKYLLINTNAKGTGIPHVDPDLLWNFDFPIPPLPEQHRIVAKIEELFSRLDKGIESLKTARQQLKTYRQAVLKWAFEGRFGYAQRPAGSVKEGELPEGWKKVKIKEIGKVINGDRGKNYPSRSHYVTAGVPFISAGNIEENKIDISSLNFITKEKYDVLNSGKLQNGDLIYCLRGSLGKCAIFNLTIGAISSSLCILRLNNGVLNQFVFYYLISPFGKDEILKNNNGTAQPNLSGKSFENYEIIIPPLPEQHLIVSEIEKRLSVADKLEEAIATALQQAEALRQSILKKAFEGKLLSQAELHECRQDPAWEPASVLLERIKAEKSGLGKKGLKDGRIAKKKSKE